MRWGRISNPRPNSNRWTEYQPVLQAQAMRSLTPGNGLAALTSMSRANDRSEVKELKNAADTLRITAVLMHGGRLAIYLGERRGKSR